MERTKGHADRAAPVSSHAATVLYSQVTRPPRFARRSSATPAPPRTKEMTWARLNPRLTSCRPWCGAKSPTPWSRWSWSNSRATSSPPSQSSPRQRFAPLHPLVRPQARPDPAAPMDSQPLSCAWSPLPLLAAHSAWREMRSAFRYALCMKMIYMAKKGQHHCDESVSSGGTASANSAGNGRSAGRNLDAVMLRGEDDWLFGAVARGGALY